MLATWATLDRRPWVTLGNHLGDPMAPQKGGGQLMSIREPYLYPDDGCVHGGPSCLTCRLPMCIHDMAEQGMQVSRQLLYGRITDMDARGMTSQEIGVVVGMEARSIRRVLARLAVRLNATR